jgi:hypothetical protein
MGKVDYSKVVENGYELPLYKSLHKKILDYSVLKPTRYKLFMADRGHVYKN